MSAAIKRECKHQTFYYYPATNEDGWQCVDCGEKIAGDPAGYRPDLDHSEIFLKVGGLLHDLHDANLIYVSNGTSGDFLTDKVVGRCEREGRFDQYSILLFLLEELTPSHSEFWKEIGDGCLAGKDPRDRCDEEGCQDLVTTYGERKTCSEHAGSPL